MRISNSFFTGATPIRNPTVFALSAMGFAIPGYAFAEFESARHAIKQSFTQENWDGYGALPIRDETRKNALSLLEHLETSTCAPEITPNPNGTLSLVWETDQGFGQLEVGRTRYTFCLKPHGSSPITNAGDATDVNPALGFLVDALLYPKPSRPVSTPSR